MTDRTKELIGKTSTREATFRADSVNEEARTVEIAFSSEAPVNRWYGKEILSHAPGAVIMKRLKDGAPLLHQHRPGEQIGVVDSARIDQDKTGRAVVRFSRGSAADEIFQDVKDGIRRKVSVGYIVHNVKLDESNDKDDTYIVKKWEPLELSLVSIPADNAVGVGRGLPNQPEATMPDKPEVTPVAAPKPEPTAPPATPAAVREQPTTPAPAKPPAKQASAIDNPDAAAIREVAVHFGLRDLAEKEIALGTTLDDFRQLVRKQQPDPVPTAPRIQVQIPHSGNLRAFRADLYGSRREAQEQAYRAGQWARAVIFGKLDSARWCRDYGVQMDQRVLTGTAGGQSVIVPDEMVLPIISLREQYGLARRMCYVHPMASDTANVPRDSADVTAYFVGREAAPTVGDPGFDDVQLTARNLACETRLSNDYADDSAINLADHVAQKHARGFAVKEDGCLFNGDGSSTYGGIQGIRPTILGLAGAVDGASGNDTFAEMTAADLRKVMGTLPEFPGINPSWFSSKPASEAMFGRLKDAVGGNTKQDLSQGEPDTWGGYDIVTSPAMPTALTDISDTAMAIFGDLMMGVILGDRRGITMMVDPYSLSSYQQTKIISSERFDLNCHGLGDASNAGPIVALIAE